MVSLAAKLMGRCLNEISTIGSFEAKCIKALSMMFSHRVHWGLESAIFIIMIQHEPSMDITAVTLQHRKVQHKELHNGIKISFISVCSEWRWRNAVTCLNMEKNINVSAQTLSMYPNWSTLKASEH